MPQQAKKKSDANRSTQERPRLRLAILGGGGITTGYYLPALEGCPEIELLAIVDPSPTSAAEVKAAGYTGKILQWTAEAFLANPALLAELRLDAVVVATPNFLHESATCKALELGLNVLCEKPLTLTELGCKQIEKASKKSGKLVAVGMVRRLVTTLALAKEVLESKSLGELEEVIVEDGGPYGWISTSGIFFDPRSGGILADMGVHYLDMLQSLLGALTPVEYRDDNVGGCTSDLDYRLVTKSKVPVRLTLSRNRKLSDRFTFRGKKGTLIFKNGTYDRVWIQRENSENARWEMLTTNDSFTSTPVTELTPFFTKQFAALAKSIRAGTAPTATVKEATEVIRLIEWAEQNRKFEKKTDDKGRPRIPASAVTVTGGAGFIGSHLLERLHEVGASLTAPVRNYKTCSLIARLPVRLPRFDILNYESVREVTKGSRYVFHLAVGQGNEAAKVTVQGTKNCVEAAIANGAECVVVLSSMYVFGQADKAQIDENSPYRPTGGEYGSSKAKMEKWCLARARTSGKTRIVVLNPSFVYGPRGEAFTLLPLNLAKKDQFCWVDGGVGSANYVYVDNVIDACLLASTTEKAHGQRFLINDGECSWKEFLTPVLGELAASVPSLTTEEILRRNREQFGFKTLLRKLLGSEDFRAVVKALPFFPLLKKAARSFRPPRRATPGGARGTQKAAGLPPDWLPNLFRPVSVSVNCDKAQRELGWKPRVSLREGQAKTLTWLRWNGEFLKK